jgi:hypothetical protein
MIPVYEEKRYRVEHSHKQIADIVFTKVPPNDTWEFQKCSFNTEQATYTFNDWGFLGCLSKTIREIYRELNGISA